MQLPVTSYDKHSMHRHRTCKLAWELPLPRVVGGPHASRGLPAPAFHAAGRSKVTYFVVPTPTMTPSDLHHHHQQQPHHDCPDLSPSQHHPSFQCGAEGHLGRGIVCGAWREHLLKHTCLFPMGSRVERPRFQENRAIIFRGETHRRPP